MIVKERSRREFIMPGTHLADSGTYLETANRVSGLVSPEVKEMWKRSLLMIKRTGINRKVDIIQLIHWKG